jgi:tetratricopeptide (TPR) repeat protein
MDRPSARISPTLSAAIVALLLFLFGTAGCGPADEPGSTAREPAAEAESEEPAVLHPGVLAAREAIDARDLLEARRQLETVPPEDPSYVLALSNLTTIYASLGELELASKTYRALGELKSDEPSVFVGLGWVEYRLGRLDQAEFAALRAIELVPEDPEPRYNVAFFRLVQGRLPEATLAYHRAMKLDFEMAYVNTARGHLLRLQEERPDFADLHYALAYIANSLGDRRAEMEELERYLALNPEGPTVAVARARLDEAREALVGGP